MQEHQAIRSILRDNVDIYQCPQASDIAQHSSDTTVILGDLHGNAIKFLHLLVREGFVNIAQKDYDALSAIYQSLDPNDTKEQKTEKYKNFLKILSSGATKKEPCPKLRLIGDDFFDRGKNDLFTVGIYNFLDELKVEREIIASNHGVEFLKQFAYGFNANEVALYQNHYNADGSARLDSGGNPMLYRFQGRSGYALMDYIKLGVVDIKDVETDIQAHYFPYIKLLSYSIDSDKQITIHSHGPITEQSIRLLCDWFDLTYQGNTVYELADTIDKINTKFSEILNHADPEMTKAKLQSFFNNNEDWILNNFVNDRYDDLPQIHPGRLPFDVINVHGHVGQEYLAHGDNKEANITRDPRIREGWTYINLDSDLGKADELNKHAYIAAIATENLKLESKKTQENKAKEIEPLITEYLKIHAELESILKNILKFKQETPKFNPTDSSETQYKKNYFATPIFMQEQSVKSHIDVLKKGYQPESCANAT